MTRPELLAVFEADDKPQVLARQYFYVPAQTRGPEDEESGARSQAGCVFLHQPTVALLLPSDMPPLSQRRPDFGSLRHVLARFSFMLGQLPPKHTYASVVFTVTLTHPGAVVRLQRPAWEVHGGAELTDTVTTQLSAAVDSVAKLGAQRTRVHGATRREGQLPVVTAEKRSGRDFGWRYEARDGSPLHSRIEYTLASIELPRDTTELSGQLTATAMIEIPRWGKMRALRATPGAPPMPFQISLGSPG